MQKRLSLRMLLAVGLTLSAGQGLMGMDAADVNSNSTPVAQSSDSNATDEKTDSERQIAELNTQIETQHSEETRKLNEMMADLRSKLTDAQETGAQNVEQAQQEIKRTTLQLKQLQSDKDAVDTQIKDKDAEIQRLTQSVTAKESEIANLSNNNVTEKEFAALQAQFQQEQQDRAADAQKKNAALQVEQQKLADAQSWMGTAKNHKTQIYTGVTAATVFTTWMLDKHYVSKNGGWKKLGCSCWNGTRTGVNTVYVATIGKLMSKNSQSAKKPAQEVMRKRK